jgi:hypothetical protein
MLPYLNSILRHLRPFTNVRADWRWLAQNSKWQDALNSIDSNAKNVLIATSTGSNWPCSSFDSLIGVALTMRGARVSFLLCDGSLPACQECDIQWISESKVANNRFSNSLCNSCYPPARDMLKPLGLPILNFSNFANKLHSKENFNAIDKEQARAATLRYYARGDIPNEDSNKVYLNYLKASSLTREVISNLTKAYKIDVAVLHHGLYVPQGSIMKELNNAGIRSACWVPSYRNKTVIFSHNDAPNTSLQEETIDSWINNKWDEEKENKILKYLVERRTKGNDWINFQPKNSVNQSAILSSLGVDSQKPMIGLLTNVIWDAQVNFKKNIFPSMLDWLFFTIEYFIDHPDLQLIIRIHPAEKKGTVPSRQPAKVEIFNRYKNLPNNIFIVDSDSDVQTYELMLSCDSVLTYGTKTALELACFGMKVSISGESWCKNKGFTVDHDSPEEYKNFLNSLPVKEKLQKNKVTLARMYAYHLFFGRMIEIRALKALKNFGPFGIKKNCLELVEPGSDHNLDMICEGILEGTDFIAN